MHNVPNIFCKFFIFFLLLEVLLCIHLLYKVINNPLVFLFIQKVKLHNFTL